MNECHVRLRRWPTGHLLVPNLGPHGPRYYTTRGPCPLVTPNYTKIVNLGVILAGGMGGATPHYIVR